ncbi:unnamed protein product [Ectocarpus sp. 13 AM-2016]
MGSVVRRRKRVPGARESGGRSDELEQPVRSIGHQPPFHNKRSSFTTRAVLLLIMLAVLVLFWYVFGTTLRNIAAGIPISRKGYRVGSVSGVVSEGFHARRRVMARGGVANPRERAIGEPAGLVFQETWKEEGKLLPAATLFAAAGPAVVVLDRADHLQNVIRRCMDADGCDSEGITREIRSQVSALVLEGSKSAAKPESAPREGDARGDCDASSSPLRLIAGHVDDATDDPSRPTGRDDTATPGELICARGYDGGPGRELDEGGVGAALSLATAASAGSRVGKGEEDVLAEAAFCDDGGKGQALEGRIGGGWCDAWSSGQGGRGGDAELWTTVLVASGWRWDEVETLLEVFPGTPWLYLYHEGDDGTSKCCLQSSSRYTGMGPMHDSKHNGHGHGVAMASSHLTAGAAARVLTRLFGAKLHPVGELAMSQLHARHATTDYEELSANGSPHSAASAATDAAVAGFSSLGEGFPSDGSVSQADACRDLSRGSTKVLGGPFDTVWWWGSGDNLTSNRILERRRQGGVEGGSPCGSSSREIVGIAPSIESDAGRVSQQRKSHVRTGKAGGLGKKSGNSESEKGTGEKAQFHNSSSSSSVASKATFEATGEGEDRLENVKASPLPVEEEGLAMGEEPQRRWDRGLRRMVDRDSPSWMSSEVYSEPIERFSCPAEPEAGYPTEWPLLDLLANWNPGNASGVPERHFLGVCRFDYQTELHKAQAYSLREVPFIVYNVPELDRAVQEWSNPAKLTAALGDHLYSIDVSSSNRFLYYGKRSWDRPPGWTPPTRRILDTFDAWLRHALGIRRLEDHQPPRDNDHFVEASDGPGRTTDQSREDKDEDLLAPYGGEQCDRSPDRCADCSPDQEEEWFQGGRDSNAESEVVRGEETRQESPGSKAHYYLKFSSTVERPNRFVDRSLPFFVPPAQPLETYDDEFSESLAYDNYGFSPAEGDYSAGKRGRRRKRSRESRWAEQDAWPPHQRRRSEEALEGGEEEEPIDGATRKLEGAVGSDKDETDIFLRDASATKGIHCRLGMDGVMSEGHYDGSRNMVALLAGKRRWILSNPENCAHMHMFRKGHPSARFCTPYRNVHRIRQLYHFEKGRRTAISSPALHGTPSRVVWSGEAWK